MFKIKSKIPDFERELANPEERGVVILLRSDPATAGQILDFLRDRQGLITIHVGHLAERIKMGFAVNAWKFTTRVNGKPDPFKEIEYGTEYKR